MIPRMLVQCLQFVIAFFVAIIILSGVPVYAQEEENPEVTELQRCLLPTDDAMFPSSEFYVPMGTSSYPIVRAPFLCVRPGPCESYPGQYGEFHAGIDVWGDPNYDGRWQHDDMVPI